MITKDCDDPNKISTLNLNRGPKMGIKRLEYRATSKFGK